MFNEHSLEMSIMDLLQKEEYIFLSGNQIHRERAEVLLIDDLKQYLYDRYAKDGITPGEVDSVILMLRNISGTIYEANKAVYKLICNGFILNREDRMQKDLYIELIDFDTPRAPSWWANPLKTVRSTRPTPGRIWLPTQTVRPCISSAC